MRSLLCYSVQGSLCCLFCCGLDKSQKSKLAGFGMAASHCISCGARAIGRVLADTEQVLTAGSKDWVWLVCFSPPHTSKLFFPIHRLQSFLTQLFERNPDHCEWQQIRLTILCATWSIGAVRPCKSTVATDG